MEGGQKEIEPGLRRGGKEGGARRSISTDCGYGILLPLHYTTLPFF